jgi:hypothetical protein
MGDTANNWYIKRHYHGGAFVGVSAIRHLGSASINAETTEASVAAWGGIVDSARGDDTDAEFVDVCAATWPGWSGTHLTGGNVGEFRAVVDLAG